jgi:hypothetical protein
VELAKFTPITMKAPNSVLPVEIGSEVHPTAEAAVKVPISHLKDVQIPVPKTAIVLTNPHTGEVVTPRSKAAVLSRPPAATPVFEKHVESAVPVVARPKSPVKVVVAEVAPVIERPKSLSKSKSPERSKSPAKIISYSQLQAAIEKKSGLGSTVVSKEKEIDALLHKQDSLRSKVGGSD